MSIAEQESLKAKYYNEAQRYMANARSYLVNAKKDGKFYKDVKYVKTACGTAYNGVLLALDGYFALKGIKSPTGKNRKSIEYYQMNLTKVDKKMLTGLKRVYDRLHLWGYYDGTDSVALVKEGFDIADAIIEKIRPRA